MTFTSIANSFLPTCQSTGALAAVYGAIGAVTGLDSLFPAPPGVHWMLSGALAEYQCKNKVELNAGMARAAFFGFVGGAGTNILLG